MKPAANRRVSFSVFCSKDLPVTFVFAPPAPVPLLMMAGVGVGVGTSASFRFSAVMFIFCFSFFGLGVGAVVGGVFSACSSMFSMMVMLICDMACYIYFNFLILLIE